MTTYHDYIDTYADDDIPVCFAIWCDSCDEWINEVTISGNGILCTCGNMVLKNMTPDKQKLTRSQIARAIWGL